MGEFQRRVEAERDAIHHRARRYAVVPEPDRAAKLERETVEELDERRGVLLIEEFSPTWVGRDGSGP